MFHVNMYAQDAIVLVLQPYQKNGKDVWKQYSYRSLFERAFKKHQYFFSKKQIVEEFSKLLGINKFFFKGYHDYISSYGSRKFILDFSSESFCKPYLKTKQQLKKGTCIISDRLDCVEDAQYASYDIYIRYYNKCKTYEEPIHHIVGRELRSIHNITRIITSHCLPYIEDKSYDFDKPYGWK